MLLALPLSVSAGITEGLGWLASQQNVSGSFGDTPVSLATDVRSTAEVIRAYQELGQQGQPPYAPALGFLNTDTASQTRFLAHKIIVNVAAGNDVTALVNTLVTHQTTDGGFGDLAGESSAVLDTAFALQALAAANYTSGQQVVAAVGFLMNRQGAAGGWTDGNNDPSVHLTAQVFRALWFYRNSYIGVSGALGKAQHFMLYLRYADGSWGENFNTALVLTALLPHVTDLSLVNAGVLTLQAAQRADGSWDNDSYTTALALQSLMLYELRKGVGSVQNGSISGTVIKAGSTEPIAGATVTVNELTGIAAQSNADGYFLFSGLPSGTYTLTATKSGYTAASITASAQSGQVTVSGNLVLGVAGQTGADQTGLVRGKVYDAANLLPVAGTVVALSGAGNYPATTNANGEFDLGAIPVGSYAVTITKGGYYTVNGSATLAAGQTLVINQGLTKEGAFQDADPGTVNGTVVNAKTGLPLAGALFDLGGGLAATTTGNEAVEKPAHKSGILQFSFL